MRVGIFFGGPSREREISFAGGRTVYDNLDKALFTPIPIFVDSLGNFIQLHWQYLYKGTIRDFYPPGDQEPLGLFQHYIESCQDLTPAAQDARISRVGQRITPDQFAALFDFAFLALHGPYGEDGTLQGLLSWYNIPYSGSGVLGSAIGIDKVGQRPWMQHIGLATPACQTLDKDTWQAMPDKQPFLEAMFDSLGCPLVVKSPCQGSSLGVSIVRERDTAQLAAAIDRSLFIQAVTADAWRPMTLVAKQRWIASLIDLREGIGLPVTTQSGMRISQPVALLQYLDQHFATHDEPLQLTSVQGEEMVLLESFVAGREFSCIVLEPTPGTPIALPPTEMVKGDLDFDYRAKYLPGIVRKETPIQLPDTQVQAIRKACAALFKALHFQVYARIDGFITPQGAVYLNDPNTTAGMNPSSFLFHQAAEIGLNPTQLLTFLIRTSLTTRIKAGKVVPQATDWLARLDTSRTHPTHAQTTSKRIGIIMGGFSAERHVSLEGGRNIYEKLASSGQYTPIPLFLAGTPAQPQLFTLPINMLLKENADDIHDKLQKPPSATAQSTLAAIRQEAFDITQQYGDAAALQPPRAVDYETLATMVDFVFLALHGRPGEDGTLQTILEQHHIPYNGSGVACMERTMDKFETNQFLRTHGIHVADQVLVTQEAWDEDPQGVTASLAAQLHYPMIAKPVDEGCSAAVVQIKDAAMLAAYAAATFRTTQHPTRAQTDALGLQPQAEFPQKPVFLVEVMVTQGHATHFLEITGGLLTHYDEEGRRRYEIFMPSETVATGEVLSLEEKFLAGEGQNITPARFHPDSATSQQIAQQVRHDLQRVAQCLDVEGYARIDAFVKVYDADRVETWIIEVNALPAMTPATCIFHQCALNGYTPLEFIHHIIQYGLQKHASNQH